ncbi:hypothetical protein A0H81_02379 [Grifola frondosa]|uniref:Uncharacterized protein n=1 Tax=Grifola frondosa TaxID=5627 RepID=A0A1C7MKU8_GRIFR|nr:hypothetical protein A0H81_02379 [Grifola frondosa]
MTEVGVSSSTSIITSSNSSVNKSKIATSTTGNIAPASADFSTAGPSKLSRACVIIGGVVGGATMMILAALIVSLFVRRPASRREFSSICFRVALVMRLWRSLSL